MSTYISVWPVIILALIHFLGTRLKTLSGVPRSIWLSMAGGVSVAYVFLHLFPELNEGQTHVEDRLPGEAFLRHHVYIVALVGLIVFYGLERAAILSRQKKQEQAKQDLPSAGVFWIHIGSFAVYNALIGYLLFTREEGAFTQLLLFSIAMALHFMVNDFGLL
ncbi:MAG: ZIP family metal transporter, partial [Bacteroidetes bacterium]|nr:ZIP family metal transporter [Bacteroidota bacterium]